MAVSLSDLVKNQFDAGIRSRGYGYFTGGQVKIRRQDPGCSLDASVEGSSLYEVSLERERGCLDISCTCPYFEDNQECKHVWATILEADRLGLLQPERKEKFIEVSPLEPGWEPDGFGGDDDAFSEDEPAPGLPRKYTPDPVYSNRVPAMPNWRSIVTALPSHVEESGGSPMTTWPESRELIYCLDPAKTILCGALIVKVMTRQRKKTGEWTALKPLQRDHSTFSSVPGIEDKHLLSCLQGGEGMFLYRYDRHAEFRLPSGLTGVVLPLLCATGRCVYTPAPGDTAPLLPLELDSGEPWKFQLDVRPDGAGKDYLITGQLSRGEALRPLSEPVILLQCGWVFWKESIARLDHADAFEWITLLRAKGPIPVPGREIGDLPAILATRPTLPPMNLPEEIRYQEITGIPKFRLTIRKPQHRTYPEDALVGKIIFDYEGVEAGPDIATRSIVVKDKRLLIRRDAAAEQGAVALLDELGLRRANQGGLPNWAWQIRPGQLSSLVATLMERGWAVQAEGKSFRKSGSFRVEVSSGIDWFDLRAKVDFEGVTAELPALLKALQNKEQFITLGDGTVGILPQEWLRKYGLIARMGTVEDDAIRFQRHQSGLLDALIAAQPEVNCDETFTRIRAELKSFETIKPVPSPAGFVGVLRDYQAEGLGWLQFLERFGFGGCLADDMGLGKTVQVLAHLEHRRSQRGGGKRKAKKQAPPSLVVVPRSLVFNWIQEAARFTPGLKILDHTHPAREREAPDFSACDCVLVTYGVLCRDIMLLKELKFDYVILDESQAIKNEAAQAAKAARLLQCDHRLAMSGTPVQNHLGELWSLFEFLNPGILGAASLFNSVSGLGRNPSPEARTLLAQALRPFILRRTKGQVARELPERTEETLYCELEGKQRKLYDELRQHYKSTLLGTVARIGIGKSKIMIIEALLRLRQAACHPGLVDKRRIADSSAKLDALMPRLAEVLAEGHKAIVFSQFTSFLELLRKRLRLQKIGYEYLDGQTRDRQTPVERFQNDEDCKLFLVSLKAGGVGLNLTAAEYVFLLDPWWNPAIEAQAIDRAHRIGQTRNVFAYRLIARDTVEEKILELQKTKKELTDSIISADNSLIRTLTKEDLQLLLG